MVFYEISLKTRDGHTEWKLEKRFSDFDTLNLILKESFEELPELPGKTFFALSNQAEIDHRKQGLDKYLKALAVRKDVMNYEPVRQFLQLTENAPELLMKAPTYVGDLTCGLGVSAIHFDYDRGVLFVGSGDMDTASRFESYLTNLRMPWEEKKTEEDAFAVVGTIECYVVKDKEKMVCEKVWSKPYSSAVNVIEWDARTFRLLVGLDNGTLELLSVPKDTEFKRFTEVFKEKVHENGITGACGYESFVLSCGKDGMVKVCDNSSGKVIGGNIIDAHTHALK